MQHAALELLRATATLRPHVAPAAGSILTCISNWLPFTGKIYLLSTKISFALYLIHQFISIEFIIPALEKYVISNFWITSSIALTISISIAAFITYYIEIPLGKKMNTALRIRFKLPLNHP